MAAGGKNKRTRRTTRAAEGTATPPIPPTELDVEGFVEALDEVRATVIALLATLRVKEADLRERGGAQPAPGVLAGLNDIGAIRVWADRTLRTLDVLSTGQTGELSHLLEELGEFKALVEATATPPPPSE